MARTKKVKFKAWAERMGDTSVWKVYIMRNEPGYASPPRLVGTATSKEDATEAGRKALRQAREQEQAIEKMETFTIKEQDDDS